MAGKASAANMKKAKAAASSHNKKGQRNPMMHYVVWIGVAIGSIVVACVMLVVNPDRGPFQKPVNDPSVITHINRNAKTWKAGASSFFEGWTIGDVKMLEGIAVSSMGGSVGPCVVPDAQVPEQFDARQKWPECFTSPIYNMGNCTASWAIATASALSNRFCISSPSDYRDLMLSPQQLLSCDAINRGCNGGDLDSVWKFIERQGLVSEMCFPYQADGSVSCQSRCANEASLKAASHCMLSSEAAIKREVFLNGPVIAPIFLIDDFLTYRGGLYQEMSTAAHLTDGRRQRMLHAVKIVGWGRLDNTAYWVIENSWGEDWGENGFAKVATESAESPQKNVLIESYVIAGTPASKKLDLDDDIDTDFEADVDLDNLDELEGADGPSEDGV